MATSPLHLWFSVLILAVLLFVPISKIIWTMSVRRMQRKLNRELTKIEIAGQLNRARFIAILVAVIFSYLFNTNVIQRLYE